MRSEELLEVIVISFLCLRRLYSFRKHPSRLRQCRLSAWTSCKLSHFNNNHVHVLRFFRDVYNWNSPIRPRTMQPTSKSSHCKTPFLRFKTKTVVFMCSKEILIEQLLRVACLLCLQLFYRLKMNWSMLRNQKQLPSFQRHVPPSPSLSPCQVVSLHHYAHILRRTPIYCQSLVPHPISIHCYVSLCCSCCRGFGVFWAHVRICLFNSCICRLSLSESRKRRARLYGKGWRGLYCACLNIKPE